MYIYIYPHTCRLDCLLKLIEYCMSEIFPLRLALKKCMTYLENTDQFVKLERMYFNYFNLSTTYVIVLINHMTYHMTNHMM